MVTEKKEKNNKTIQVAKPFVKWAGGKGKLLKHYLEYLPEKIEYYYEPFLGGGGVYFGLQERIKNAVLSDVNQSLTNAYRRIKTDVENLIEELEEYKRRHSFDFYMETRRKYNEFPTVAAFIYLNKTCFNGLYRVNRAGHFNVPMGDYQNPIICDADNLRAVSQTLKNAVVLEADFETTYSWMTKESFIYLDPPYDNVYTGYTSEGFDAEEQKRLARYCQKLDRIGAKFMMSNANTPLINSLYVGLNIRKISAARTISCKGDGRDPVKELVITNY
jgi:DNA adenine methylase